MQVVTHRVPTAIADLFEACRDSSSPNVKGQNGGYLCPVPPLVDGEALDPTRNCNHGEFSRLSAVRDHFNRQHFDYGILEGGPRTLRFFPESPKIVCGCGDRCKTLEEMDAHTAEQKDDVLGLGAVATTLGANTREQGRKTNAQTINNVAKRKRKGKEIGKTTKRCGEKDEDEVLKAFEGEAGEDGFMIPEVYTASEPCNILKFI